MRRFAGGLLAAMAVVFLACSLGAQSWPTLAPPLGYLRAFAEAAMVGACADWFAVSALFRRPLGLPIPHTAIIPRNKAQIGRALGDFIAGNFLTEAVLEARLRQLELARFGGDWLRSPANARRLAERLTKLAPQVLAGGPADALGELAGAGLLAVARALPVAPLAASVLAGLWREGHAEAWLDRGVTWLETYVASQETIVHDKVAEQSPRWLPKWVDRKLAAKIQDGLLQTVADMRDPDHPWRRQLEDAVAGFVAQLHNDPGLQAKAEAWKLQVLTEPGLITQAGQVWDTVQARVSAQLLSDPDRMADQLERAILGLGAWLAEDAAAQARLNTLGRSLAIGVLAPRRGEIGRFIAQVVDSWDTDAVVGKLELQFGRDLQFIRINGTLVGGLVGLVIFAASRALGLG